MSSKRRYITIALFSLSFLFIGLTAYILTMISLDSRTSALGGDPGTNVTSTPVQVTLFPVTTSSSTPAVTATAPITTITATATATVVATSTVTSTPIGSVSFTTTSTPINTVTTTLGGSSNITSTAVSTTSSGSTLTPTSSSLPNTGLVEDSAIWFVGTGLIVLGIVLYYRFKERWYF